MSCSPTVETVGIVMKGISRGLTGIKNKRVRVLEKQINLSVSFMSGVSGWEMKMWKNAG